MRLTDLNLVRLTGTFEVDELQSEERQCQPLDAYAEFAGRRGGGGRAAGNKVRHSAVYPEVLTDEGVTGVFGPVEGPHAPILLKQRFRKGYLEPRGGAIRPPTDDR